MTVSFCELKTLKKDRESFNVHNEEKIKRRLRVSTLLDSGIRQGKQEVDLTQELTK